VEFKPLAQVDQLNSPKPVSNENKDDLPLTAHNRKAQMAFLRKVYICVIIQTLLTMLILFLANYLQSYKDWINADNNGIISFGVGMGVVVLMSLIAMFAPLWVRNLYVCFPFLTIFGICLGLIVGGLGSSIYMLTEYGVFIQFLLVLFVYTFFVEIEFLFWKNYLIGTGMSIIYLIIVDGVVIKNWLAVGCLIAGALFFNFYAILFSQFIIARNAEMFRIGDYVFGALKFNMDMGDVIFKIFLDYAMPYWIEFRKRHLTPPDPNKFELVKPQVTKDAVVNNIKIIGMTPTISVTPGIEPSPAIMNLDTNKEVIEKKKNDNMINIEINQKNHPAESIINIEVRKENINNLDIKIKAF